MSKVYDNWDRLVRATLREEELRIYCLRTPSDLSLSSSSSPSFNFSASSRRPSSFKLPKLVIGGEAFDYDHLLRATNYFDKFNLISNGRSGDLFTGVLDDGTPVVVKKIDLSAAAEKEAYLVRELEVFGKVSSHSRLVPLIGHCLDNFTDKFLVYKYMPNRDLSRSLFKDIDPDDEFSLQSLDWITRLKIAIGAAEALCYLHHDCFPPLVHRDVQASSILLDDHYEVRLGSLSDVFAQEKDQNMTARLLRLMQDSKQDTSDSSSDTLAYDVYCFGKVLLELVTGKLGISAPDDAATKDWLAQMLPYISIYDMELVTKIVDPSLIIDEDLLEEVWAMAIIARSCLNPKPSRRPIMRYILKALENPLKVVRDENSSSARLKATSSSPSSFNAAPFGNWQLNSPDVEAVPSSLTYTSEGASSFKQSPGTTDYEGSVGNDDQQGLIRPPPPRRDIVQWMSSMKRWMSKISKPNVGLERR